MSPHRTTTIPTILHIWINRVLDRDADRISEATGVTDIYHCDHQGSTGSWYVAAEPCTCERGSYTKAQEELTHAAETRLRDLLGRGYPTLDPADVTTELREALAAARADWETILDNAEDLLLPETD